MQFGAGACLVQSNKIITMAGQDQPPIGGPPQDFGPPGGPIAAAEIRILYLLVQIQHGLGRMEEAIGALRAATESHNEDIKRLIERTIKAETTLTDVDETVDRHRTDLDGLGARHSKDLNELKNDVNALDRKLENDINQVARRLENKINELGTGIDKNISDLKINDIGKLNNIAHTTASFGKFAAGGGLLELLRILITHHW